LLRSKKLEGTGKPPELGGGIPSSFSPPAKQKCKTNQIQAFVDMVAFKTAVNTAMIALAKKIGRAGGDDSMD
jgi:hypothetical protein